MFGIDPSKDLSVGMVWLIMLRPKDRLLVERQLGRWPIRARSISRRFHKGFAELIGVEATLVDLPEQTHGLGSCANARRIVLTPDTRSKEPDGSRSALLPLQPGALPASFSRLVATEKAPLRTHDALESTEDGYATISRVQSDGESASFT